MPRRNRPPRPNRETRRAGRPGIEDAVFAIESSKWPHEIGQAFLWSFILLEISRLIREYDRNRRAPYEARIAEVTKFYPDADEYDPTIVACNEKLASFRAIDAQIQRPSTSSSSDCVIVSIGRVAGYWTEARVSVVEMASCRDGTVKIRCLDTSEGRPKLPPFVSAPKTMREAREAAVRLVRAAIALVDQ